MERKFTYTLLVSIPWGDADNQVPVILDDFPAYGFLLPEQLRKVRKPLRIRIDANGNIYALVDFPTALQDKYCAIIYHFDAEGIFLKRMPVKPGEPRIHAFEILDFAADVENNLYILARYAVAGNADEYICIRKINTSGAILWEQKGQYTKNDPDQQSIAGRYRQVLLDNKKNLWLPSINQKGKVIQLDCSNGNIIAVHNWNINAGQYFIDTEGSLYALEPQAENKKVIVILDPLEKKIERISVDKSLYEWLTPLLGVDDLRNIYSYNHPVLAKIALKDFSIFKEKIENIVVDNTESTVNISYAEIESREECFIRIESFNEKQGLKKVLDFQIPGDLVEKHISDWKLIHIDNGRQYYILGGEAPGQTRTLLVFSENAKLQESRLLPLDLLLIESTLSAYDNWIVAQNGKIYFPVTDNTGFKVICFKELEY